MQECVLTAPSSIRLVDVEKRFANGTTALRGIDLSLQQGEFTCLVGPSGCGKSTVLRIIAGLSEISGGEVRRDSPIADSSNEGDRLGFVFQEPTLLPWSKVWENVYLPLKLQGLSRDTARPRVDDALRMVDLTEFATAYPRELSGGMKMRTSIARALVTHPRMLLMDEPFGALDEPTRFALNDQLLALWLQNRWTIAFVTHSVYEAVYLAQRVVVLSPRPGRVVTEIAVDADYPRDASFRRSDIYHDASASVLAAMESSAEVATA